jgi:hypothetical protein
MAVLPRPLPVADAGFGLLAGAGGLVLVAGIAFGAGTPLPYLVALAPAVVAISWFRPVWGLALLLGVVLLVEQYGELLAPGVEPLIPILPIYVNLEDVTPLPFLYANVLELWIALLWGLWAVAAARRGSFRLEPVACPKAFLAAALVIALTFVHGVADGGDLKIALWEVRALGYLFGVGLLVPQVVRHRRDMQLILWVAAVALAVKALEGLWRFVVQLRLSMALTDTFLAHEDPVMFVPLVFLLAGLVHYQDAPRLRRFLWVSTPVMVVALLFTQRRVAYVSLGICALAYALQVSPAARRTYARLALPAVTAGLAYAVFFLGSRSPLARPIHRALSLFEEDNASNLYRVLETANLRDTITAHPLGVGFGQPFDMIRSLPKVWVFYDYIPHNEILWIWAKAGTLGFVVVMFFFARLVAEAGWTYRHLRLHDGLLRAVAAVVGLAVINQLVVSYYDLQLTYARNMLYLGVLIGLLRPIQGWGGLVRAEAPGPAGRAAGRGRPAPAPVRVTARAAALRRS